jgi:ribosomal protein L32
MDERNVRHAHWEKIKFFSAIFGLFRCSGCGEWNERRNFCPDCGARMDEEVES